MKLSDFSFELPNRLIAQYPLKDRSQAKLMVLDRITGKVKHCRFSEIIHFLSSGDLLVLNNTRVLKARLFGYKSTGGRIEVLLVKRINNNLWQAMLSKTRGISPGKKLFFDQRNLIIIKEKIDKLWLIEFNRNDFDIINKYGRVPLPPYIKRKSEKTDEEFYQTVYARQIGSIAAPTAGLHFTKKLLNNIKKQGIEISELTLHIGPGTFKPIRTPNIETHKMDSEYYEIPEEVITKIKQAKRVIAVGTSVCRALESYSLGGRSQGEAELFIYPGHQFKLVNTLLTNFHLPGSTPLLLVSAFAGKDLILKAYQAAINKEYRFLSYGDAMFIV